MLTAWILTFVDWEAYSGMLLIYALMSAECRCDFP